VRQRLPLLLALLTAAVLLPGAAAGAATHHSASRHPASGAAAATSTVHVRPLDASGRLKPGYHVAHRFGRTSCFLGGIADGAAYRCFAGNNAILDPCWRESATSLYLDCLVTPWRHAVVRLHATKGIDDSGGALHNARPWAVRLHDGTRCVGSQGAAGAVGGLGISFFCLHTTTVLVGDIDRSGSVWRIRVARTSDGGRHYRLGSPHRISRAYVGEPSLHS
jgi:hypothetical protein